MKKSLYYLLFLAVCFTTSRIHAQDTSDETLSPPYLLTQKKYTFTGQPLQWFNCGWRFDFEMRLGDGPGWLQFGPTVYFYKEIYENEYYSPNYYYDGNVLYHRYYDEYNTLFQDPFSKMRGYGLDVNYKRFINSQRSFYLAGGLSFSHFNMEYWGRKWENYIEDGLQYHIYRLDYLTQYINRLGVNAFWGYQVPYRKAFVLDMFWGLAYRHSFSDKNKPSFNGSMISYGYSGIVFLTGVRWGFGIK